MQDALCVQLAPTEPTVPNTLSFSKNEMVFGEDFLKVNETNSASTSKASKKLLGRSKTALVFDQWLKRHSSSSVANQALVATVSAGAASAALYAFGGLPLVVCVGGVVLVHEAAHSVVSWAFGAKPMIPLIIPAGPITLGISSCNPLTHTQRAWVSIAGPLAGLAYTVFLFFVSAPILLVLGIAASELYALTLGSDAKTFRRSLRARH